MKLLIICRIMIVACFALVVGVLCSAAQPVADVENHVFCRYFNTGHDYDRGKREWTYWWLNRWLRGDQRCSPEPEPATQTLPVPALRSLTVDRPNDKGFKEITRIYLQQRTVAIPKLENAAGWQEYCAGRKKILRELLGEAAILPTRSHPVVIETRTEDGLVVEHIGYPSEGPVIVPTWVLRPQAGPAAQLPVTVIMAKSGKDALRAQTGNQSPRDLALRGALVVLPDIRAFGESCSTGTQNPATQALAWERNGIVWGRPVSGMAVTDLQAVLDGISTRSDAQFGKVQIVTRDSGDLALIGLIAMALDSRITHADLDFAGACYRHRNLMPIPRILLYGDVLEWALLVADRQVQLYNLPHEADDAARLCRVLDCLGNTAGVKIMRKPKRLTDPFSGPR